MTMKSEWNKRAEKNAYHYVSTFREEWDNESFYKWGETQTHAVIDRFLKDQSFDPIDKTVLEIGCGAGRMSRALASRFKIVYAYDVSDVYIQLAKANNSQIKNIIFRANDGMSFPETEDESVDFAFSGWVMGHMPTQEVVTKNIREIARVLKKGGVYKIDPLIKGNPIFRELATSRLTKPIISFLLKDKLKSTPTYIGVTFKEKEIMTILSECGLTSNTFLEPDGSDQSSNNQNMRKWFYGKKTGC
jgi:ubiquinone/menaquinone biosynthesis C-methylase UbiE